MFWSVHSPFIDGSRSERLSRPQCLFSSNQPSLTQTPQGQFQVAVPVFFASAELVKRSLPEAAGSLLTLSKGKNQVEDAGSVSAFPSVLTLECWNKKTRAEVNASRYYLGWMRFGFNLLLFFLTYCVSVWSDKELIETTGCFQVVFQFYCQPQSDGANIS